MLSLKFLCKKQKILKTRPSKSKRIFTPSYLRNNAILGWLPLSVAAVASAACLFRSRAPEVVEEQPDADPIKEVEKVPEAEIARAKLKQALLNLTINYTGDSDRVTDFIVDQFLPQNVESLVLEETDNPFIKRFTLTLTRDVFASIPKVAEGEEAWTSAKGITMSAKQVISGTIDGTKFAMNIDDGHTTASKRWVPFESRLIGIRFEGDHVYFKGATPFKTGEVALTLSELEATFKYLNWPNE
jgi:hypothetical protein